VTLREVSRIFEWVIDTASGTVEKTVCKVQGKTLHYNTSQLVNFEAVKNKILGMREPTEKVHTQRKIKRKRRMEVELH